MEIDFHHGTTYVLSRMAGFTPEQAYIIAYSAQYVDDAGTYFASQVLQMFEWHAVFFDTYEIYEYIDSSHSMFDISNVKELDQHKVWIPFHFLPAGDGGTFVEKVTCRKAWDVEGQWINRVAQDMVTEVVKNAGNRPWGLHRLGITMHVLADTFAHQNFGGIKCKDMNNVLQIEISSPSGYSAPGAVIRNLPALGHARAEHLPDLPFVSWSYTNDAGDQVMRDNPSDYVDAAAIMLQTLREYKENFYPDQPSPPSPDVEQDSQKIQSLFTQLSDKDGNVRNQAWVDEINSGGFRCCNGNEQAVYFKEGEKNSWWSQVQQLCPWSDDWKWYSLGYRKFNPDFMTCNYKLFQDALKSHLYYVRNVLFPQYGICAL